MAYRILARFDDQTVRATLKGGRNVLGSDSACDVYLPNPTVSRRHAVLTVRGRSVLLEDLGSTNGTLLRSQRIDRAELEAGDILIIGRVVTLLEEVPDDDLEVGIGFARGLAEPSGSITMPLAELTESFSPLDHFTLDQLPRLLHLLAATEVDDHRFAQEVGHALYETMPVTAVEILEIDDTAEKGVLFSAAGTDEEIGNEGEWIEASSNRCEVRARFYKKKAGEHYRPVVETAMLLLTVADRLRGRVVRAQVRPPSAVRPQPPSVEPEMIRIYEQAERVARGDVGVMVYGESGTGKEVLARFIHSASPRASQPVVAINCASLPRDLLEAELFGVEGVATGVDARPGKFEQADQGTLFLDEIGDMSPETQAKILRVLQEKEVFRVGGSTPRPARCRIIAATNRPIQKMITEGTFRADLYHRIATWEVELPPLRRRRSDIPNLAAFFLTEEAKRLGIRIRGISRAALRALRRYRWPGNVRQLQNEIARAALFLEDRELLDTGRLSAAIRGQQPAQIGSSLTEIIEAVERDEILATLEACGGDTTITAEVLQVSRPTLYRRIKTLGIVIPELKES